MPYTVTDWVDGVTPVNATNLDKLEAGVADAVAQDEVTVAGTRVVANKLLLADAQPSFQILGSGRIDWGAGGASAVDTNLYRNAANVLKTDDTFLSALDITARDGGTGQVSLRDNGGLATIFFGTALDTNLYRNAANVLKTDDDLHVGGDTVVDVFNNTKKLFFGSALDTNLYRSAANTLQTDDLFQVSRAASGDGVFSAYVGGDSQVRYIADATGRITWGSGAAAGDTNLYRSAADNLKTDDTFSALQMYARNGAAGQVLVGDDGTVPRIIFGSAADTNLYRSAADTLASDDQFRIVRGAITDGAFSSIVVADSFARFQTLTDGKLQWGSGAAGQDTNLYRSAAATLTTDGALATKGSISTSVALASYVTGDANYRWSSDAAGFMQWGPGTATYDTNLYRSAADTLKTDDAFIVAGAKGLMQTGNYGTSFPGSPSDGQVYTLVDSTTVPTYQWTFRYNSGSSNTDKWEFVGGSHLRGFVDAGSTTTSTTYVEVGSTLTLTLPRAGQYLVSHGCYISHAEAYQNYGSFTIGGAAPTDANAVTMVGSSAAGDGANGGMVSITDVQITAAASDTLIYKQKVGGGTGTFNKKFMSVFPIRLS